MLLSQIKSKINLFLISGNQNHDWILRTLLRFIHFRASHWRNPTDRYNGFAFQLHRELEVSQACSI